MGGRVDFVAAAVKAKEPTHPHLLTDKSLDHTSSKKTGEDPLGQTRGLVLLVITPAAKRERSLTTLCRACKRDTKPCNEKFDKLNYFSKHLGTVSTMGECLNEAPVPSWYVRASVLIARTGRSHYCTAIASLPLEIERYILIRRTNRTNERKKDRTKERTHYHGLWYMSHSWPLEL